MRVVFRTDASPRIGSGHLRRCLTLATELRERGAEVTFVVREHAPGWYWPLDVAGLPRHVLSPPRQSDPAPDGDYKGWLAVSQDQDSAETRDVMGPRAALLIVDHYGLDDRWERQMRSQASTIMAIDDLASRRHEVDVLLDQNVAIDPTARYRGLVGPDTRLLLGPSVALLDPTFRQLRSVMPVQRLHDSAGSVLVYFGASDLLELTVPVAQGLLRSIDRSRRVEVVVRSGSPAARELQALETHTPQLRVWEDVPSLAGLFATCDMAVGAGGSSALERLCLGVPTVLVSVAENQLSACNAMADLGLARYLGDAAKLAPEQVVDEAVRLLGDPESKVRMAHQGQRQVDGLGVLRVAEVIGPRVQTDTLVRSLPDVAPETSASPTQLESAVGVHGTSDHGPRSVRRYEIVRDGLPLARFEVHERADVDRIRLLECDPVIGELELASWALAIHRWRCRKRATAASSEPSRQVPMQLDGAAAATDDVPRRVTVVSDATSWVNTAVEGQIAAWLRRGHLIDWVHRAEAGADAQVCFYLSYGRIVPIEQLGRHRHNLVVHGSDLPHGRGWSPLTWQVLEGRSRLAVTLFEAVEELDAGPVYAQRWVDLQGHELIDELRQLQGAKILELCDWAVRNLDDLGAHARPQHGEASFYRRRKPADSRLDPERTIAEQFELLRVVDNDRYPAFFELRDHRYRLHIHDDGPVQEL